MSISEHIKKLYLGEQSISNTKYNTVISLEDKNYIGLNRELLINDTYRELPFLIYNSFGSH